MFGMVLLISIGVFALALSLMAVGVIVRNQSLKGSCGGLNQFKDSSGNPICDACSNPSPSCSRIPEKERCQDESECDDHEPSEEKHEEVAGHSH